LANVAFALANFRNETAFASAAFASEGRHQERWNMGNIKIIKKNKVKDYTFVDESLDLNTTSKEEITPKEKKESEPDFRIRKDEKINKIKHTSRLTGGHNKQGHSSVYE
jgi:hypothetical protein